MTQITGTDQRHASRKVESDCFWGEFPRDHMNEGDRGERQCQRDGVDYHSGSHTDRSEQGLDDTRQRGFADPTEPKAGERDPELGGGDSVIQVFDGFLRGFRTAAALVALATLTPLGTDITVDGIAFRSADSGTPTGRPRPPIR